MWSVLFAFARLRSETSRWASRVRRISSCAWPERVLLIISILWDSGGARLRLLIA